MERSACILGNLNQALRNHGKDICHYRKTCIIIHGRKPQLLRPIRCQSAHVYTGLSFTQRVCLAKRVKNISEMEWNSFVCFTVDKENGREPVKQQRKGTNRTRRKLLLCFLLELLCLSFKLKLILKPAILLKFTHF